MNKVELLQNYRNYLNRVIGENYSIPDEYIERFWEWFLENGKLFHGKRIKTELNNPLIEIFTNACYKNSFRLMKAFKKNLSFYEGFAMAPQNNDFLRHAFNVNKSWKVCDHTIRQLQNNYDIPNYQVYFGVRIPDTFIRKVYKSLGEARYTQYSVLVPYFLYKIGVQDYLEYTNF